MLERTALQVMILRESANQDVLDILNPSCQVAIEVVQFDCAYCDHAFEVPLRFEKPYSLYSRSFFQNLSKLNL